MGDIHHPTKMGQIVAEESDTHSIDLGVPPKISKIISRSPLNISSDKKLSGRPLIKSRIRAYCDPLLHLEALNSEGRVI